MGIREKIAIGFWLIVGLGVSIGSIPLGVGSPGNPRTGFMSFFAGLILVGLTMLLAVSEVRKGRTERAPRFSLSIGKQVWVMVICLFGYALVVEWLGYLISIALFVFISMKMRSPGKWLGPACWAVGVSIVSFLIFSTLLDCKFPRGILGIGH